MSLHFIFFCFSHTLHPIYICRLCGHTFTQLSIDEPALHMHSAHKVSANLTASHLIDNRALYINTLCALKSDYFGAYNAMRSGCFQCRSRWLTAGDKKCT